MNVWKLEVYYVLVFQSYWLTTSVIIKFSQEKLFLAKNRINIVQSGNDHIYRGTIYLTQKHPNIFWNAISLLAVMNDLSGNSLRRQQTQQQLAARALSPPADFGIIPRLNFLSCCVSFSPRVKSEIFYKIWTDFR